MENFIIMAVILLIVGGAIIYIIKEKQKGAVCIGCPNAGECAKKRQGNCDCGNIPIETSDKKI